jgi:glutamyl/glutaminyl-tRNA synthetase
MRLIFHVLKWLGLASQRQPRRTKERLERRRTAAN